MQRLERKNSGLFFICQLIPPFYQIFRSRLKDICNPLLKKPVSEEGKLQLSITTLPPMFGSKREKVRKFDFADTGFDSNWIGLEN